MKWTESGFRPPLCTYRLNWARRTSWGLWDDWDDTVLQTQDSKFEPWRSEAEHATSRPRRLSTILTFTRGWGRNIFCFFQTAETGNRAPNSGVKGSGANLTTTLGPPPMKRQELTKPFIMISNWKKTSLVFMVYTKGRKDQTPTIHWIHAWWENAWSQFNSFRSLLLKKLLLDHTGKVCWVILNTSAEINYKLPFILNGDLSYATLRRFLFSGNGIFKPFFKRSKDFFKIVVTLTSPEFLKNRILNPVSGGQCHLIHLTILRRFSWLSLAYMCTKVA